MLNVNQTSPETFITEGSEVNFNSEVIEASSEQPVIAYFTATWCGPCKTMGPIIEQEVSKAKGKLKLVKYDVDNNRNLAMQMRIQSIPTIYAFHEGNPIDGFMGAKPTSEITEFISKLVKLGGGVTLEEKLQEANELLKNHGVVEAMQIFASILQENPENPAAYAGLIKCHLYSDELDKAEAMLSGVPQSITNSSEIEAVKAKILLSQQALNSGPTNQFENNLRENPDDHQSRYDLAIALYSNDDVEGSVEELLELFRRDKEWNDGAAKQQLLTIFEALNPQDPIVLKGRRRLTSMIFY